MSLSDILFAICILTLWTLIPGLELRASIPVGVLVSSQVKDVLPIWAIPIVCVIANILIGWLFFFMLKPLENLVRRISWIDKLFQKYLERARLKLKPGLEKYGTWGLAFFIGIPLPMTGAYTGAAGAYALGMNRRQFIIANVTGVLMAGIIVTIVVLLIRAGVESPIFDLLIKK